ncbi:unnamed protein product, partial [Mesorhabditis spiculigera]
MKTTTLSPPAVLLTSEALALATKVATTSADMENNSTKIATRAVEHISSCFQCQPLHLVLLFAIVICIVIVAGVIGNAFVVGVVVTDRKLLHSSVNLFLLNLALADMGNLIFCAPDAILVLLDRGWLLPPFLCPIVHFLQEYYLYASVLLQMSIGVERYMAICSPLRITRFTRRTTAYFLIAVWAVAAAFASPYFLFHGIVHHKHFAFCYWLPGKLNGATKTLFRYSEFAILYGVPLVLLTVLYSIMGRVLWGGKSANIANESQQVAILRLRRSVVKMLMISMLIYFLCYSPIQGMTVGDIFFNKQIYLPPWIRIFVNVLPMASSSANPIVYIMCCRHFHQRFVALMQWAFGCCGVCYYKPDRYVTTLEDKPVASRTNSRSPYVSFRKSVRRHNHHSITLL